MNYHAYIIHWNGKECLIPNATISTPPVTCYPLCRGNTEGSKNLTFVCIQSTSVLSAQAEDPLELFRIRPVGDVGNSIHQHFRKLQQPNTQKHMKENADRKNKTQSNFKLSHDSPCLQHLLIFHWVTTLLATRKSIYLTKYIQMPKWCSLPLFLPTRPPTAINLYNVAEGRNKQCE